MYKSAVPVGQKPEVRPVKWGLPRLVSSKDLKTQSTAHTPTRSASEPPSLHGEKEQKSPPETIDEGSHRTRRSDTGDSLVTARDSEDQPQPLSPVLSSAGSAEQVSKPSHQDRGQEPYADEDKGTASLIESARAAAEYVVASSGQVFSKSTETAEKPANPESTHTPSHDPQTESSKSATSQTLGGTDPTGTPAPYHSMPKITIQQPSNAEGSEDSGQIKLEKLKGGEHIAELTNTPRGPGEPPTTPLKGLEETGISSELGGLPEGYSTVPSASALTGLPTLTSGVTGIPDISRITKRRKRVGVKHKARNLAARKTILKVLLGRQLAGPTKQTLRGLAKGAPVGGAGTADVGLLGPGVSL